MFMKKLLILFILLFITFPLVYAQHITFLGVPLKGNINTFSQKLLKKSYSRENKKATNLLGNNKKFFDVPTFGYPATAIVEYDESTKNVYEAILMFNLYDFPFDEFERFVSVFENQIEEKYNSDVVMTYYEEFDYGTLPGDHWAIYYKDTKIYIGEIFLYLQINNFKEETERADFMLHIMYRNAEAPSFEDQMRDYY